MTAAKRRTPLADIYAPLPAPRTTDEFIRRLQRDITADPLDEVHAVAAAVLSAAGFRAACEDVRAEGEDERIDHYVFARLPAAVKKAGFGEGSQVWIAARLVEEARRARNSGPGPYRDRTLLLIGALAAGLAVQDWYPNHLHMAERMKPARDGLAKSNAKRAEQSGHDKWRAMALEKKGRNPQFSDRTIAISIIKTLALKVTVRHVTRVIAPALSPSK